MPDLAPAATRPTVDRFSPYVPLALHRPWRWADGLCALALGLATLAVYTATTAPGLSSVSVDSNELATKSAEAMIAHTPGSPVYVWIGHLFSLLPFGEIATRVNWMSAVCGALAVALLFLVLVRHVTGERLSAMGGALLFPLGITVWSQAVVAELYVPNIALLSAAILGLLEWAAATQAGRRRVARRWLAAAVAAFGLSLGVHLSNVLYLPAIGAFVLLGWPVQAGSAPASRAPATLLRRFDWRTGLLITLLAAVLTLGPWVWVYLVLPTQPARDGFPVAAPGWPTFYASTLDAFAHWRFYYGWPEIADRIVLFLHLLAINVGAIGLALIVIGAWRLLYTRLRVFYLLLPLALGNLVFFLTYKALDIDSFFIPTYLVAAGLIAAGLEALIAAGRILAGQRPAWLPGGVVALVVLAAGVADWQVSYDNTNLAPDHSFRDFYGNVFSLLPRGAYVFNRGAAFGYDLVYYTELYHVRPDLHLQIGPAAGEARRPPWPPGPVFSGSVSRDLYLPAFLANPQGDNLKWFDPLLQGMLPWDSGVQTGWLKWYRVQRDPPPQWLVPASDPRARPRQPLNIRFTPDTTLIGIDAAPQAARGRPWHLVRYWRTTTPFPPHIATVLGNHAQIEVHELVVAQFQDYLAARGIPASALPQYVLRDDMHLVIPSNLAPSRYAVSASTISPRLTSPLEDPAPPAVLLPDEHLLTTLQVVDGPQGPAPDPRTLAGPPGGAP